MGFQKDIQLMSIW